MEYLTTKEAAEHLNLSVRHVQTLIEQGHLPATKFGHAWQIRRKDVEVFQRRPVGRRKKTDHDNSTIT